MNKNQSETPKLEENNKLLKNEKFDLLFLILGGIGLGWMISMSKSPIIVHVITTLLALLMSLVSIMGGVKEFNQDTGKNRIFNVSKNPRPIAVLLIGISLGTVLGLKVKSTNLFKFPTPYISKLEVDEILSIYAKKSYTYFDSIIVRNEITKKDSFVYEYKTGWTAGLDSNLILTQLYGLDLKKIENDTSENGLNYSALLFSNVEKINENKLCDEIDNYSKDDLISKYRSEYRKLAINNISDDEAVNLLIKEIKEKNGCN